MTTTPNPDPAAMLDQVVRTAVREELTAILQSGNLDIAVPVAELIVRYPRALNAEDSPAAQESLSATHEIPTAPAQQTATVGSMETVGNIPDAPAAVEWNPGTPVGTVTAGELDDAALAAMYGITIEQVQEWRAGQAALTQAPPQPVATAPVADATGTPAAPLAPVPTAPVASAAPLAPVPAPAPPAGTPPAAATAAQSAPTIAPADPARLAALGLTPEQIAALTTPAPAPDPNAPAAPPAPAATSLLPPPAGS